MPMPIGRDEVREMLEAGAAIVDVLPPVDYEEDHLPGAINIPLKKLDAMAPESLAKDRPVVVYCYDPL